MEPKTKQQQHIRPKVRSRPDALVAGSSATAKEDQVDKMLEQTRQRIQSHLVVSSKENYNVEEAKAATVNAPPPPMREKERRENARPKGILKTPKYSSKDPVVKEEEVMNMSETSVDSELVSDKRRAAVKDVVMEREPIPQLHPSEPEALSVEGYTPKSDMPTTVESTDSKDPLVFTSISELMDKAGTLPAPGDGSTPQVVEADLSFACMTAEEYDETVKCAEAMAPSRMGDNVADTDMKENVFIGQEQVFSDDDSDWSDEEGDEDPMFGGGSDATEEDIPAPEPRAFMKLWEAITGWATPEAVALLKQWRLADKGSSIAESVPQVDQSDVGSSRRKGLKAMLNMYLPSSMDDLGLLQEDRRQVELRLDNFLRTLNYSEAMVKFDSSMWKAMTCVLIEMVMVDSSAVAETQVTLPAAAKDMGMVLEEYRYLTRSAVINLES